MPKEALKHPIEATLLFYASDCNPQIAAPLARWIFWLSYIINSFSILLNLTTLSNLSDLLNSDTHGCMLKGLKHIRNLIFPDNYIMSPRALVYFTFPCFFLIWLTFNILNCLSFWIYFLDYSPKNSTPWYMHMLWFSEANILIIKESLSVILT